METTVIPTGASAVVTADDRHHHGGQRIDETILRETLADHRADVARDERFAVDATTSRTAFALDGAARADRYGSASALAAGYGVSETKDARRDVIGVVGAGFTAAALASSRTDGLVGHEGDHTREKICHLGERASDGFSSAITEAAKNAAALSVQAQGNTSALGIQSDKNAAALGLQATTFYGQASVQVERIRAELGMLSSTGFQQASVERQNYANLAAQQAERIGAAQILDSTKNAAAAILLATQNQAALAAQIAKCCCEQELRTESLRAEMIRLATFRVVPAVAASAGGIFPAGA